VLLSERPYLAAAAVEGLVSAGSGMRRQFSAVLRLEHSRRELVVRSSQALFGRRERYRSSHHSGPETLIRFFRCLAYTSPLRERALRADSVSGTCGFIEQAHERVSRAAGSHKGAPDNSRTRRRLSADLCPFSTIAPDERLRIGAP
jgi:hypothetical protein